MPTTASRVIHRHEVKRLVVAPVDVLVGRHALLLDEHRAAERDRVRDLAGVLRTAHGHRHDEEAAVFPSA